MNQLAFLSLGEVCDRLSVSRATLWRMTRRGDFPKPVRLSPGRVGVPADEFHDWQQAKRDERTPVAIAKRPAAIPAFRRTGWCVATLD